MVVVEVLVVLRVVVEEVAEEWEVSPALNLIMVEASEGVTRSRWLSSPRWQEWQAMVEEEEEEGQDVWLLAGLDYPQPQPV